MSSHEAVIKDRRPMRPIRAIIALLATFGCAGLLLSKVRKEFTGPGHFVAYEILWWVLVALLLCYVRWTERQPLSSIGFRRPGIQNILIGIGAGIVVFAG